VPAAIVTIQPFETVRAPARNEQQVASVALHVHVNTAQYAEPRNHALTEFLRGICCTAMVAASMPVYGFFYDAKPLVGFRRDDHS
jgi:hypothetical protein